MKCPICNSILFKRIIGRLIERYGSKLSEEEWINYKNNMSELRSTTSVDRNNCLLVCSKCSWCQNYEWKIEETNDSLQ